MDGCTLAAPVPCLSCEVVARDELQLWADELVVVNHYLPQEEPDRVGWVVVSPRRHVTRWFELTAAERDRIAELCAYLDWVFTSKWGATRTMVSSLGWEVSDHLHVHCVPTFTAPTRGHLNFELYEPIPQGLVEVCRDLATALRAFQSGVAACGSGMREVRTRVDDRVAAEAMADALVAEHLAACTHIRGPLRSTYYWQGELCVSTEWELDAITLWPVVDACVGRLLELHPYETPAIARYEAWGSEAYSAWVKSVTGAPEG